MAWNWTKPTKGVGCAFMHTVGRSVLETGAPNAFENLKYDNRDDLQVHYHTKRWVFRK